MASYKSQFSTTSGSRGDNADPFPQRTTSTRLPTRKNAPIQPQFSAQAHQSPSKLTKKRPGQSADNARGTPAQKGSLPRPMEPKAGPQKTASSSITTSQVAPQCSQPRPMLPATNARVARFDTSDARTPSLVSGSSASTGGSPKSNVLRRKASSIGRTAPAARKESLDSTRDAAVMDTINALNDDPFPDSILGIHMPPTSMAMSPSHVVRGPVPNHFAGPYPAPTLPNVELPPPSTLYTLSATPSTGYSGSPGPFSVASTPTSMSSFSPATTVTSKGAARITQPSPTRTRPPVTRRVTGDSDDGVLSSVRESSSSSGSTARNYQPAGRTEKSQVKLLPAISASPPPSSKGSSTKTRTGYDKKAKIVSKNPRPNAAVPPELAHLVDAKPIQKGPSSTKPARPSRDGTPDYVDLREPSPIIQSNLSTLPSSIHRRQASMESRGTGTSFGSTTSKTRLQPSRLPSRTVSPSPSQFSTALSPSSSRVALNRRPTPEVSSESEKTAKKGAAAQSSNKSGSRFGFFRRKTEPVATPSTASKPTRKGPMAGTGHEGYGKYSYVRGRSGSTTSGDSSGRSPSADSGSASAPRTSQSRKSSVGSKGTPEMDDFLLDRLAPRTLRGSGEMVPGPEFRSQLQRTQSQETSVSSTTQTSVPDDATRPKAFAIPRAEQSVPILYPPADRLPQRSASPAKRHLREPSPAQSSSRFGLRSLGGRRLSRMSTNMEDNLPPNFVASSNSSSPQINSVSAEKISSNRSKLPKQIEAAQRSATVPPPKPQGKLSRKWNFFQRTHVSPKEVPTPNPTPTPAMAPHSNNRSMAHYALVDRETSKIDMNELERIMQEADESPDEEAQVPVWEETSDLGSGIELFSKGPQNDSAVTFYLESHEEEPLRPPHGHSMLLPERPVLAPASDQRNRPESPVVQLRRDSPDRHLIPQSDRTSPISNTVVESSIQREPQASPFVPMPPQRAPRLQQVGRIPQVRRDRERKLSVHSFSRPFANDISPALQQQSPPIGSESPQPDESAFPQLPRMNDMVNQLRLPSFADEIDAALNLNRLSVQTATTIDPTASDGAAEFLSFPLRKDSDISVSTSSGHPSFKPFFDTASAQPVNATFSNANEDQIWREYDDLIDDVLDQRKPNHSESARRPPALQLGTPFQYPPGHDNSEPRRPSNATSSSTGKFLSGVPSMIAPNTPFSITDFVAAYGSRDSRGASMASVDPCTFRSSLHATGARSSTGSHRHSNPSSTQPTSGSHPTTLSSSPSSSLKRDPWKALESRPTPDTIHTDIDDSSIHSQVDEDPRLESVANLRLGALMTSKWLSFGRVLFSPAHFELKDPRDDRVLIIDGLGKDWSYYVALAYPTADVFSLGPDPSSFPSTDPNASNGPLGSMPNHRHIHHPMLSAPFPFPKGFFAAVVLRFPVVAPEGAYRTVLYECKRVLRPGGYLEISALDMDPLNMGNMARKAVKGLKMKIAERNPEFCLRPVSDVIFKLLGRRGFEGMQRCTVGVPAAGAVRTSGELGAAPPAESVSPDSVSSNGLHHPPQSMVKPSLSFSDLLNDEQDGTSPSDNKDISRMVARVGRWWYEKCYESAAMFDADGLQTQPSIWKDKALLRECEKRGTTFRLLICHAQKPDGVSRRTVSV